MAVFIMGTVESESLVIFAGDNSDLCLTPTAMMKRALVSSDPLIRSRVVIFGTVQLPKGDIGVKRLVSRSLHQAAVLHKFLHEHVLFTLNFCGIQNGIFSGGPPLDFSVYKVRMVIPLLYGLLIMDMGP